MHKVIGGEFEIDISSISSEISFNEDLTFSTGRSALYHILKLLVSDYNFRRILLPDYLCESILHAVKKANLKYDFYSINYDLSVNFESIYSLFSNDSILLFINYFGCVDVEENTKVFKKTFPDSCVITDNVQAYYAMGKVFNSDFAFTSLRKTFPLPDGAIVYTSWKGLSKLSDKNTFISSKIAGGILKYLSKFKDIDDKLYLDFFMEGEDNIDKNYNAPMSEFSKLVFSGLELCEIAKKRRENAAFLLNGLKEINVEPIVNDIKDFVPLFIPIRIFNRDEIRKKMFLERIYLPIHWPVPQNIKLKRADELARTELSLIVDQRYDVNDMEKILNVLSKFY